MELARLHARGLLQNLHPNPLAEPHQDTSDDDEPAPIEDLDDALATFGLVRDGAVDEDTGEAYLWPENREAWGLWLVMQTQWRVGMGGATGLDYAAMQATLGLTGVKKKQWPEMFQLIRAMEIATLDEWGKQRKASATS